MKQSEGYISYSNCIGGTSIRFTNYKLKSVGALELETSECRRTSISECMDTSDIDTQIKHYEQTLKNVRLEYDKSMIHEWSKIRERKLYFIREIARLKKL